MEKVVKMRNPEKYTNEPYPIRCSSHVRLDRTDLKIKVIQDPTDKLFTLDFSARYGGGEFTFFLTEDQIVALRNLINEELALSSEEHVNEYAGSDSGQI